MIYNIKMRARNGEEWEMEIEATNPQSAIKQMSWWLNEGRYSRQHQPLIEYGIKRFMYGPIGVWVDA